MNKLSKEKRDKLLLIAVGTGAVVAGLYLMVISGQKSALNEYAEKTEATKEKLAKAERWLRMSPGIQVRLDSSLKELEAKQEGMAPVDKFKWFYNTLDRFLAKHPVKLTDITREPELGDANVLPKFPYQAATFGVKVRARYHDFGAFLADFENQFPYMRVKNLDVEPEGTVRIGNQDVAGSANRSPETLAVTMRVVTLVKPTSSL